MTQRVHIMKSKCMYCEKGSELHKQMLLALKLTCSDLYLFREQSYPGRCILVFRDHKHKLSDLTEEEYFGFCKDARKAAKILQTVFRPDKINYLILGDICPHLHLHLVPKYKDMREWGSVFQMFPEPAVYPEEKMLSEMIRQIQEENDLI